MTWASTACAQAGVIGRAQLRRSGTSDRVIDGLIGRGGLVRLRSGVFLVRGAPLTYEARLWTAVLATQGVLGFGTAAQLWGYIEVPPDRIDVIVGPHRRPRSEPDIRLRRTIVATGALVQRQGLPITNRSTTLVDHLGDLRFGDAARLADRALQRGWLTAVDIDRRLRQQPGRSGNTTLRWLGAHVGDGAAAESERVLHALLRRAGIRGWRPQRRRVDRRRIGCGDRRRPA